MIDASGRPGMTTDLNFTPFMAAIPVLRSFVPLASNQLINVTWTTNTNPISPVFMFTAAWIM